MKATIPTWPYVLCNTLASANNQRLSLNLIAFLWAPDRSTMFVGFFSADAINAAVAQAPALRRSHQTADSQDEKEGGDSEEDDDGA